MSDETKRPDGENVGTDEENIEALNAETTSEEADSAEGDAAATPTAHTNYQPVSTRGEDGQYQLTGMYQNWFLDYASYAILDRAVPHIDDGLKPVQRRILHTMKRLDDGRFSKVANIVGQAMQFHPHGDASIGSALVQLGQKDLLVEALRRW